MAKYRNTLSVLPLYDHIGEQLHRRSYTGGYVYPLISSGQGIPFFASWPYDFDYNDIVSAKTFQLCDCGDVPVEITPWDDIRAYLFYYVTQSPSGETVNGIRFRPDLISEPLPPGQYYLEITLNFPGGLHTFFSEVFTVVPEYALVPTTANQSKYIKLTWNFQDDVFSGNQYIPSGFDNILYLNTVISRPEYQFEEEGKERNGYYFPEKQISKKVYRFKILAPENVCDVLRLLPMADSIEIVDQENIVYKPLSSNVDINWLDDTGYLAEVTCEFMPDTVVKVVGKPL